MATAVPSDRRRVASRRLDSFSNARLMSNRLPIDYRAGNRALMRNPGFRLPGVSTFAIGIGASSAMRRGATAALVLLGISPADPASVLAVTAILVAAGVFACWLPGRRAANLDPGTALYQR